MYHNKRGHSLKLEFFNQDAVVHYFIYAELFYPLRDQYVEHAVYQSVKDVKSKQLQNEDR